MNTNSSSPLAGYSKDRFRLQIKAAICAWVLTQTPVLVTAGDFNGDGFDDVAVGVPKESIGSATYAGAVQVFKGSATGLTPGKFWNEDTPNVRDAAETYDTFGAATASSDFNGDGFDDLAVGVPGESCSFPGCGAVHVFYGQSSGLQATDPDDQRWTQDSSGVGGVANPDDYFGWALAACNFDGDAFADLAIGAYSDSDYGSTSSGVVNVLYGSGTGLASNRSQVWTRNSPGVRGNANAKDYLGSALTCADFNGDGFDDLAIGVRDSDPSGVINAGTVSVIFGSVSGLQATGNGGPDDQLLGQSTPEPGDQMGASLATCDINGDGRGDLAIGVPLEDADTVYDTGLVNVFYGSSSGLGDGESWTQDSAGVRESGEQGDKFGFALACADFNGDGFADLAVGVPYEDRTLEDVGVVQILFGSAGGLQGDGPDDQLWSQNSVGVIDS